jgi:signal transduction histidine kinase
VAISNLIENASKYSPSNSVIHIRVEQIDNHAVVSVRDQGVGIAKQDIPKVFEKFTRLDNELSDTVNGSGLGLYFVKKIAKLHNGRIDVVSTPRKGSEFSLRLPL